MSLPFLLSVPHAGLDVPREAEPYCILTPEEIRRDGDEGAAEIYALEGEVDGFLTTRVARAIVDLNRAEDDRRADGAIKTHTCWNVPVYREPLPEAVIEELLASHHRPYHERLRELGLSGRFRLGIDCHTMAPIGPPVGPDAGARRPRVCLSHAGGTCPQAWIESLKECFEEAIGQDVRLNDPFQGGFIVRSHAAELPWLQLELSREPFMPNDEKRAAVLRALGRWHRQGSGRL